LQSKILLSMATQEAYVRIDTQDGIAHIEFFHPSSNSLPAKILKELAVTITKAGEDKMVQVIILRSAGEKAFCAGASFDELIAIQTKEDGESFFSGFAHVINAMRKCPKFIIGRIHGKAVGGGVGLASATDYAIAVTEASVKLSELAVGIGPFVVGPAVQRKTGLAGFGQLAVNATEWQSAQWALTHGLYTEVHNSTYEMDKAIEQLANKLAASSPEAMAEIKKILWEGTEQWDNLLLERAAISGRLVLSEFTRNAIHKFKGK